MVNLWLMMVDNDNVHILKYVQYTHLKFDVWRNLKQAVVARNHTWKDDLGSFLMVLSQGRRPTLIHIDFWAQLCWCCLSVVYILYSINKQGSCWFHTRCQWRMLSFLCRVIWTALRTALIETGSGVCVVSGSNSDPSGFYFYLSFLHPI